jgi:hypothetical protein
MLPTLKRTSKSRLTLILLELLRGSTREKNIKIGLPTTLFI